MLTDFEFKAIELNVKKVMKQNLLGDIHAIKKMKEKALECGFSKMAESIDEYQNILIERGEIDPILVS